MIQNVGWFLEAICAEPHWVDWFEPISLFVFVVWGAHSHFQYSWLSDELGCVASSLLSNDSPPAHKQPHVPVAGDIGIHTAIYRRKWSFLFCLSTSIFVVYLVRFWCLRTIEHVNWFSQSSCSWMSLKSKDVQDGWSGCSNVMSHHFLFLCYIHFIFNSEHYLYVCIFKTQLAWIISCIVRIKCRWNEGCDILSCDARVGLIVWILIGYQLQWSLTETINTSSLYFLSHWCYFQRTRFLPLARVSALIY